MEFLTVDEVAKRTRFCRAYWYRLIAERRIPTVKLGRAIRIRAEDLDKFTRAAVRPSAPRALNPRARKGPRSPSTGDGEARA
jgi:excisionase family DNA binding protein